jgi:hypothetical protein
VFCSQCGLQVQPGSRFCNVCGASIQTDDVPLARAAPPMARREPVSLGEVDPRTGLAYSHRSKVVAGLLQIFLPGLGIGRFYTGHVGLAVGQIVVTFITCGLGALWPIVDGVVLLASNDVRDADGRPLRG